ISGLSLFMLYWEAIDSYKQGKIAEAALVVSAEKSLNTEEATLEQLKKNSPYSNQELKTAKATLNRLQLELDRATQRANDNHASALSAAQSKLDVFWMQRHSSGLLYNQILNTNCSPKRSRYGLMSTAAAELCPSLNAIKRAFPDISSDPDVKRIQREIANAGPAAQYQLSIDNAEHAVNQASKKLADERGSASSSGEYVYPAMFHQLEELLKSIGVPVTVELIASLFGATGIFLVLHASGILASAKTLVKAPPPRRQHAKQQKTNAISRKTVDYQQPATVTAQQEDRPMGFHASFDEPRRTGSNRNEENFQDFVRLRRTGCTYDQIVAQTNINNKGTCSRYQKMAKAENLL
ncbi:MAG: hypothetical protein AAF512_02070, partial [Pseudomonadota bacterium]